MLSFRSGGKITQIKGPVCRIKGQKWDITLIIMFPLVYDHLKKIFIVGLLP